MNSPWHNYCLSSIVILAVCATSRLTQAELVLQPPQLAIGDQYRLAFTTSTTTDAMPSDIQYYNDFVQAAADASPPVAALGQTWTAIGSTADVDARTNTQTDPIVDGIGVPIFLVDGSKIADNYNDLWDGSLDAPIDRTEIDTLPPTSAMFIPTEGVWTGTRPDSGLKHELFFLGDDSSDPIWGGDSLTGAWSEAVIDWTILTPQVNRAQFPLYALSGIITVVPEPPLVNGGWDAILPPGLEDYVDVVDNGTDLVDGELVNFLTITADFKQGPSNGRFPSVPIAFRQTHEDAAEYIVIEEQINFNSSGGDWTGFEFTLAGGGVVFDLANTAASGGPVPIGYSVAPFTSAQFTDDNTRLAISAGRVDNGALWFPGSGTNDGQLWIDVTPGSEGDFSNFTFLQRPVAVPEPGTISMLAIGLAIILLRRSPERVTRDP